MSKGLDVKRMNSQLNAHGYKVVPMSSENDTSVVVPPTLLFPKLGVRPEIPLKLIKKPLGSAGRKDFQVWRLIGMSKDNQKYCVKVLKTYLQMDPDINMNLAKKKNDAGPIKRVIQKVLLELPEFQIYEKYDYWPLDSLVLLALRSSSQGAKGYAAKYRAKKKKEQEEAGALQAQHAETEVPEPTVSQEASKPSGGLDSIRLDEPQESLPPACAPGEVDMGDDEDSGNYDGEGVDEGENPDDNKDSDDDKPEDTEGAGDEGVYFDHAMDISFQAPDLAGGPKATDQPDEELMEGFSVMTLDAQDNQPEELSGPILPQALSSPSTSRSRSNPFVSSPPPRRRLIKPRPITAPLSSPPSATNSGVLTSSSALEGVTPELIAQLSVLPSSTLAAFPPELQAAVAAAKTAAATPNSLAPPRTVSTSNPTPTGAPASTIAPAPTHATAPTRAAAPAGTPGKPQAKPMPVNLAPVDLVLAKSNKAPTEQIPIGEPFNDDEYASDAVSASESNPPIDESAFPAHDKQVTARATGAKATGAKATGAKATGARVKGGNRAKSDPEEVVDVAKPAGLGGKGRNAPKEPKVVKGASTGVKHGVGQNAVGEYTTKMRTRAATKEQNKPAKK